MEQAFKVLFIGDIVAKPGRQALAEFLPNFIKTEKVNLVIANVENLAGGRGVSEKTLNELKEIGIDYFTSGNHVFYGPGHAEILNNFEKFHVLRPDNYLEKLPGGGVTTFEYQDAQISLINLEGSYGMHQVVANPFTVAEKLVNEVSKKPHIILCDFHAEATSEKRAMGFFLDGKVTACLGTHTHVATTDAQLLPKGTAYVTDVGMTGNLQSVLGVKKEIIINRFLQNDTASFEWEYDGEKIISAVLVETNFTGIAKSIKRIDARIP